MTKKIIKRPPRVFVDKKDRYIKSNGKKIYLKSNISNKQLVNIIIHNFEKRNDAEEIIKKVQIKWHQRRKD